MAALLAAPLVVHAAPELPEDGHARYWVQEGGVWLGYETVEWETLDDGGYRFERLRDERTRAGDHRIRRTREISEGTFEDGIPQPETYRVRTATVFQRPDEYDPETAFDDVGEDEVARLRFTDDEGALEDNEVAAPPGTLDPVVHRWWVMAETRDAARHARIAHDVIDRDGDVEEIAFRVEGRQTVRTPGGVYRTVRLARIRPAEQRQERWYLAEGWAGLPVRTRAAGAERRPLNTALERVRPELSLRGDDDEEDDEEA